MNNADEQYGRERCLHDRFIIRKRVEVSSATKVYDGVLRNISVGGAAIQVRGPLYEANIITVDINDLGEFEVTEQQTIDLAAKLVGIYYGAEAEKPKDPNEIEKFNLTP